MVYFNNNQHSINMGGTHFNIDAFFLDNDLKVVGLQRNLKAHPGENESPEIENTEWVFAQHLMEMRSGCQYTDQIKQGSVLRWLSQQTVKEIKLCMAKVCKMQQSQETAAFQQPQSTLVNVLFWPNPD